jgi:acyl dehydratase
MEKNTGWTWDQFELGQTLTTPERTVTAEDIQQFAELSGDHNPIHTDPEFASKTPFRGIIAHGHLMLSVVTGLAHELGVFTGTTVAFRSMTAKFLDPILPGDSIHAEFKVQAKEGKDHPRRGNVIFLIDVLNQDGKKVGRLGWTILIRK